ncbi:MAG: aminopeptidase P family N-terminal domain-containing protein, partial [Calditrichaceae bacterium]
MNIPERLAALRNLMKKNKIDAYIIPSTDPHQSEYVPKLWQRRPWISGFDGSAGDVIVTMDKAGLWTDSRYFLQAADQLKDTGIELYKIGIADQPTMFEFLRDELKKDQSIGIDPRLQIKKEADDLRKQLANHKIKLIHLDENLVDKLWEDKPGLPDDPIMAWDVKYAGESVESKLKRIREKMEIEGADVHVLTTLDSIAWTFNIRGNDVEYNPVVIAYAFITKEKAELFVSRKKVKKDVKKSLKGLVKIYDYEDFPKRLQKNTGKKIKVWLDIDTVSAWVVRLIDKKSDQLFKKSPITLFKACKNDTEIAGFKACHVRDGVAMVKFLHWLSETVPKGGITEISASDKLTEFRASDSLFKGLSFATISGYNEHGAIVHYESSPETDVELKAEGIYLIDSGGQYLDGTTDITRTVALGEPT